jgi:hypothetical protein
VGIEQQIIDMPAGMAVLMKMEIIMSPYPGKSTGSLRRTDIAIPSG